MRRDVLLRSVARLLDDGAEVTDAAYMWRRHRWVVPFTAVTFVAVVLLAENVGWTDWPTRIALGFAASAVAVAASTDYRVLADTASGQVLCKASRIRQAALSVLERLDADALIERVGGTVIATDWQVGDEIYTVPRSSEQAMHRIAAG